MVRVMTIKLSRTILRTTKLTAWALVLFQVVGPLQSALAEEPAPKPDEQAVEKTKTVERVITTETSDGDVSHKSVRKETMRVSANVPVHCLSPHAACEESKVVIDTLMKVSKTYSQGDFDGFGKFLDDDVTVFDDRKKKLIVGKEAVLDYVKKRWKDAHVGPNPVLSYTIEHPYAKVNGDTAVVTFKAIKVIGGTQNPGTYESKSTDIFVKKHGEWKKLHYVSHWKKVKS